jgi:4'-phosphopantetheinyl transferase
LNAGAAAARRARRPEPLRDELERSGGVHLFVVRLPLSEGARRRARACLTGEELARAARFAHAGARERHVAGRAALRTVASACGGGHPRDVALAEGPEGKPELPGLPGIGANVSHTGSVAVVAVAAVAAVGVDVEESSRAVQGRAIAERHFDPGEAEQLAALDDAEARDWFIACWTAKEAVAKALGHGLGAVLRGVAVDARPRSPVVLRRAPGGPPPERWTLRHVCLAGGRETVAVAVPAPDVPLASVRPLDLLADGGPA